MTVNFRLRQARNEDYDSLRNLHRQCMKEYVEPLWGWDEKEQKKLFDKSFNDPSRNNQVIEIENKDVGLLTLEKRDKELFLANIFIHPSCQNKGLGTQIVSEILETSKRENQNVLLNVLTTNPAINFYQRLGFSEYNRDDFKVYMRQTLKKNATD